MATNCFIACDQAVTALTADAATATPTELQTLRTALGITSGGTPAAATDTTQGIVALNSGTSLPGDATDNTSALTAAGAAAILNDPAGNNALQAAVLAVGSAGILLREAYVANTDAPATVVGNQTRELTHIYKYGPSVQSAVLNANGTVVIPAGTYRVQGFGAGYGCGDFAITLADNTTNALYSYTMPVTCAGGEQVYAPVVGHLILAAPTTLKVNMYASLSTPSGQGKAIISGTVSTFVNIWLEKVA